MPSKLIYALRRYTECGFRCQTCGHFGEVIILRTTLYDYCVEQGRQELLTQWDTARNAPLTPQTVTSGSKRSVWWRCEKGHKWRAIIYTRTGGSGCPYCTGKQPVIGENDLAALWPDLAAQWHPTKNQRTPADVLPGSHYMAWWVCKQGHQWQAMVKSRVKGSGCPVCANRRILPGKNDLAAAYPDLARQWHPTKNKPLTPRDVVPGTRRKVWWRCGRGHEWQATIASRACGGAGCPVCAGKVVLPGENDLASRFPDIAGEWHPTQNGSLTPAGVSASSNKKVWWRCPLGHSYQAVVAARTAGGSGCPYCAGRKVLVGFNDLAYRFPAIAAQWYFPLNGALTPEMVTAGSHRKVWWQCPEGHVWKAVICSRTSAKKCGCPVCAGRVKPEHMERYRQTLAEAEQHRKDKAALHYPSQGPPQATAEAARERLVSLLSYPREGDKQYMKKEK